jgi:5-methylcytosine-specific restriction protein A
MPDAPPVYKPTRLANKAHSVRPPDERESAAKRGYDWKWQKLRRVHLIAEPLCRYCYPDRITLATEVDHIETIETAPEKRLDPNNLASTCSDCHKKVTAKYDGSFGRPKKPGKKQLADKGILKRGR